MTEEIRHFDNYSVSFTKLEYYIQFKVYEAVAWDDSGSHFATLGADSSSDITQDLRRAQVAISGSIKWDGCADLYFMPDEDGYAHYCGLNGSLIIAEMLVGVYKIAAEVLPSWYGD